MATMFGGRWMTTEDDDCVLHGEPTICSSDTGSSNGGLSPLLYSPGAESWKVLTGCSGPNASRAQPFIGQEKGKNEGKHKENEKEHEQDDEAERGGAFGPRFTADTRLRAARAPGQISRSPRTPEYLAGASRDQSMLYNDTHRGNGRRTPPLYFRGDGSSEAPAGSSRQAASRFGNEEDKKEDDTEDEGKEEEEVGGIGPRFNLGMALKVVRDLFEKATSAASVLPPDNLPDAWLLIERQRDVLLGLADSNHFLCGHASCVTDWNSLLRRQRDDIQRKYDRLEADHDTLVAWARLATTTATPRAQQAPTREAANLRLQRAMVSASPIIENARHNPAEEGALRSHEHDANVSSPLIVRKNSPMPLVSALSALAQDEESPAAGAAALLARQGTPATRSMTPPLSKPACPAHTPAAYPADFREGALEDPRVVVDKRRSNGRGISNARKPAVASVRGTGGSACPSYRPAASGHGIIASSGGVGACADPATRTPARRQGITASSRGVGPSLGPMNRPPARRQASLAPSGGVGPSAGPVNRPHARRQRMVASSGGLGPVPGPPNRPPARRQGIIASSRGIGQSTRPIDHPPARQSKTVKNTTTCRNPVGCMKGTIASQLRSRQAVKTGGPRGMVF